MAKAIRRKEKIISIEYFYEELQSSNNENEVRHKICAELGISQAIKLFGSTDGVWNDILFEFKFDKRFYQKANWNKTAFGALAQSIYYCRRILNFEYSGIFKIPHTIVICDKNGAFFIPTKSLEWVIQFDPVEDLDCPNNQDWIEYWKDYEFLRGGGFSWNTPPSSQNPLLVELLMNKDVLKNISYLDFKDVQQLNLFIDNVKNAKGELPKIQITQQNFIDIFDNWFKVFAKPNDSRRDWVDRFILDLRCQYTLNRKKGVLENKSDEWKVPVDRYDTFWKFYKRPPSSRVDEFIVTNKDLLYDVRDQNNHGDFYTPLKLVNLAHQVVQKHIDANKSRVWWDPAAGGGNLFFRFNEAQKVILSTKFDSDAAGLKNNPSVKSDLVLTLDFVNHLIEQDMTLRSEWEKVTKLIDNNDELVFFMNPPFDDQAESGGTNNSLPDGFLFDDDVTARAMRALHSRFLYRILSFSYFIEKPIWVACFSKTAWIVGPDSESFYSKWTNSFDFVDGFVISSKVFNGTKGKWPCLFSLWKCDPQKKMKSGSSRLVLPVYDADYSYKGLKTLKPFSSKNIRLSTLPRSNKNIFGGKENYQTVVPVKNEFEVSTSIYQDKLPKGHLGYLYSVANDVYHSSNDVQIFSSIYGGGNANGSPIMPENFEEALAVYGIRKCIRRDWLNDKDEFYFPAKMSAKHETLKRMSAVFALVDGGYSSSLEDLKYKGKNFSLRNQFFIACNLELRNWESDDLPETDSYASKWLKKNKSKFSEVEKEAIKEAKRLIRLSFANAQRAKGDVKRQLWRGDAGMRQLINGLLDFSGAVISKDLRSAYTSYLNAKEKLRKTIEKEIYKLDVLLPFEPFEDESIVPVADVMKALKRAKKISLSLRGKK